jgi:hypothetical protein
MKMPIKWHEEGLANQARYLAERERYVANIVKALQKQRADFEFCMLQLETAKNAGKDGYDNERYMVRKNNGGIL